MSGRKLEVSTYHHRYGDRLGLSGYVPALCQRCLSHGKDGIDCTLPSCSRTCMRSCIDDSGTELGALSPIVSQFS